MEVRVKGSTGIEGDLARIRNLSRVLRKSLKTLLSKSANFVRPDRYVGGAGRAGEIATWAPGYRKMRVRARKKTGMVTSARPYAPYLTPAAERVLCSALADYIQGKEGVSE